MGGKVKSYLEADGFVDRKTTADFR